MSEHHGTSLHRLANISSSAENAETFHWYRIIIYGIMYTMLIVELCWYRCIAWMSRHFAHMLAGTCHCSVHATSVIICAWNQYASWPHAMQNACKWYVRNFRSFCLLFIYCCNVYACLAFFSIFFFFFPFYLHSKISFSFRAHSYFMIQSQCFIEKKHKNKSDEMFAVIFLCVYNAIE